MTPVRRLESAMTTEASRKLKAFSPIRIGSLEIGNRFVHSATHEAMATVRGEVTDDVVKRYRILAKGEIGLIIPGFMFVDAAGKAAPYQTGIHCDEMIPGLKKIVDAVHEHEGKIAFQLSHAGRQTTRKTIGRRPVAPSGSFRDPINILKPHEMNEEEIHAVVAAFGGAALRAVEAGADGIELHAAHGYLINQFLSPFFNRRNDSWGGTAKNRFRFLKEVLGAVKRTVPESTPVLVKLNTNDYTPWEGINTRLATQYAENLARLGVDALELSSGTLFYSFMNVCRGEVPVRELAKGLPIWLRPWARIMFNRWQDRFKLEEAYHLEASKQIKPVVGNIPLILVGGLRSLAIIEDILQQGYADLLSMSRPFVRDPLLVKRMKDGEITRVTCTSCNKCLAAVLNDKPLRCYA
jgi:2,4-dienoyl-CoA reductase-like NADH-dependent reductase (Old Yellow Enzyme family)